MIAEKLRTWLDKNSLQAEFIDDRVFKIGEMSFFLLPERRRPKSSVESIFTERFDLNISKEDEQHSNDIGVKNFCFQFGNNFYYTPVTSIEDPKLNILKYIGQSKRDLEMDFSFLGLRGKYELCNGSGDYKTWIEKAKFMGMRSLGIAEHNTLAGTLPFQGACQKAGMKFILGETITVKDDKHGQYLVKCYAMNQKGWFNLLYINKIINVDNIASRTIDEKMLRKYGEGLVLVLDPETPLTKERIQNFQSKFDKVFYQLDMTQFKGHEKERNRLLAIKKYLDKYTEILEPILIHDAFYLDSEYQHMKKILNNIGSVKFQFESNDQHFKSLDEVFMQWQSLFNDGDERLFEFLMTGAANTMWVSDNADYEIETGHRHLPVYEHDIESESNEELFFRLIGEGMEKKGLEDKQEYWDRIEKEVEVIKLGNVVDYFLILWDIIEWCKTKDILTGVGRGSSAGSLVSYLLGITGIDPIEYGLLFERFLNKGRVVTSLPDIDTDFEGKRREEVKRYMENKYGIDYVCSVGTYGTFKLRSAIKDVGKQFRMDPKNTNYITAVLELDLDTDADFTQIFKQALDGKGALKEFIAKYPHVVDSIPIVLKQPKNASIHACATLILPKKDQHGNDRNIYNWIPVKSVDGVLVSEWEGGYLEDAGFLKEDILGIKQLDKFRGVFDKVKQNRGIDLTMDSVDLNDERIYDLFRQGLSADVFHFGSRGLTGYAQDVQPFNKEEMIAMISLYRPGTIESNAHTDYVAFKFGAKEPTYDYMLEKVTGETYGLYVYQEQVMMAVQELGGMDLVTADDIRKAMGKMKMDLIQEYRVKFVEGAVANGCDEIDAETIWNKLEAFAKYGFNKSHAAAYTYTGIMCQWLKVNFPIEFWTTSFEFATDLEIPRYVSEVSKLDNGVSIVPPNVNKSQTEFLSDFETGKIYWAINKIKWVGDSATEAIINEREDVGDFFSLEEFYERVDTSKVNKRVIEHLILAGCFDEMNNIEVNVKEREKLLDEYYVLAKTKPDQQLALPPEKEYNWYWTARQKLISGLGQFDLQNIIMRSKLQHMISQYMDPIKLQAEHSVGKRTVIAGLIVDRKIRRTRKGDEFCAMIVECNDEEVHFLLWPDAWVKVKNEIEASETGMFIGSATVHTDSYKKCNVLQSDSNTKIQIY